MLNTYILITTMYIQYIYGIVQLLVFELKYGDATKAKYYQKD
jgi:hypothetical protein